ncbi:MFS transporter [Paenibacillus chartarius]|uniref:MFS transporter n=1 Tax=Paenibacillus chartarius TaxID=747481 RepID=A0ABV6DIX1_9BACL
MSTRNTVPAASAVQTPVLPEAQSGRRASTLLAVVLLSVFLPVANIFIVNVAAPSIQLALHASFAEVQFLIAGYTVAYAAALIIGGRLGDRYGRKRMLLVGVAGFTLAALLCGLSTGVGMLLPLRVIQGVFAAMMAPQVLSLIQANYAPERRAAVFGLYGAAQGVAATSGQLIGGLLLHWNPLDLDWRTVFFFSVPVGLLILCLLPSIGESKSADRSKLDIAGAILAAAGIVMLIYPLVQGQKEGWPAGLIACLALSVPVLAGFVWYERRLARIGRVPFMNVGLFRQRSFSFGMLVVFVLLCSQSAYFLVSAYFLQIGLGFTALKAGLVILPMGAGYFAASLYSARAAAKFGPHVLTAGAVLTSLGYALLAAAVHRTGTDFAGYEWIPVLAVLGLGQGAIAAPLTNVILAKVRAADIGSASGILTTGMQAAFAIGIALTGLLLLSLMSGNADAVSQRLAPQLVERLGALQTSEAQKAELAAKFRSCYGEYAHSSDPSVLPDSCKTVLTNDAFGMVMAAHLKLANAANYAYAFEICLYVLALFTAALIPLVLGVIGRRRAGGI